MDKNHQQGICEIHSLQYIAIDQTNSKNIQNRYLCPKCLLTTNIKNRNLSLINDAQKQFEEAKYFFQQRKEDQSTTNLGVLKDLSSNIVSLQNHCNQVFEKILLNIQQWVNIIGEQQEKINEQLKEFNIDLYFSRSPSQVVHNSLKNVIQTQLESLTKKQLFSKCMDALSNFDDRYIDFEYSGQQEKQANKELTPSLPLICEYHQLEIVQINLNQEQPKINRLACIGCSSGKIGPFTDIVTVQQLWSEHENQKKELIMNHKKQYKTNIDNSIQSLNSMLSQLQNQMVNLNQDLTKTQREFDEQNDKALFDTDWSQLSKEEIINIAELLSNPLLQEQQTENFKSQFEKQTFKINELIRQFSLHFQDIVSGCVNTFQSFTDQKKSVQKKNYDGQMQTIEISATVQEQQTNLQFNYDKNIVEIEICWEKKEFLQNECQTSVSLSQCNQILSSNIGQRQQNQLKRQDSQLIIQYLNQRTKPPANYQLQSQYSITQNESSYAIAINSKQTIMIAGCNSQIKVFEFQNGQMKQTQLLSDHTGNVFTLYFMKKTNQFISGSGDYTIRIWSIKDNQQYYCQQLLNNGHTHHVNQVIMNNNEDLIISCSYDCSIKFWMKKTEWECNQTLTVHTNYVWQISLNDQENQLVSCGYDSQIIISQLNGNNKWNVYQTIKVEQYGYRICYIGDNMIAFQPYNGQKMDIFELNQQNKQFIKSKDIKIENDGGCNCWFPQIFNKQKSILLNKNGFKINLMKRKNNGEIVLEQTINFGNQNVYGTMTEDGEYLITWDITSKQFQVRKQQQ